MTKTQQQLAIEKVSGPCVVLAGAGTGKTYTIVEKINHLVNVAKKYEPEEILCITFSNGATNSLKKKVQEKLGSSRLVTIKTFHAFCGDILKEDGHLLNIDEGFKILLPDDAKILIHKNFDITPYWSNRFIGTIHSAKDFGLKLEQIEKYCDGLKEKISEDLGDNDFEKYVGELKVRLNTLHLESDETIEDRRIVRADKKEMTAVIRNYDNYKKFSDFIDIWKKYDALKKEKNYLDFSDLNLNALGLLSRFNTSCLDGYKYVFVDEFQDTNKVQFELIKHFAPHKNITVVGDPNQAIYGFRGSYKKSFEQFKKYFNVDDATDLFKLNKSYRSPNTVLNVAHDLIVHNYEDEKDCILVQNVDDRIGDNVVVTSLVNGEEEARYISELVEKAILDGVLKNEICILFRTHHQSETIRRALELKNIPVIASGKTNMMQRREIRTVIAYLSILSNLVTRTGTGEQSWWDLFHYHNTLSPADSVKIGRYLKSRKNEELSIDELLLTAVGDVGLSSEGSEIVRRICDKLSKLLNLSNKTLPNLVLDVYELSGLNRAFTHERTVENVECLMNLKKFHEIATGFYELHEKSLPEFIKHIEIMDSLGVDISASKTHNLDAVQLMTIHAAKGLEYDTVIVSNLADKRFPLSRTRNEPLIPKELRPDLKEEMESWGSLDEKEMDKRIKQYEKDILLFEERRLCYVAFTRAKKNLVLTYARTYNDEPDSNSASVFLEEIDYTKCSFVKDETETSAIIAPNCSYEKYKSQLKEQLVNSLDVDDFDVVAKRLMSYIVCRDKKLKKFKLPKIDDDELKRHVLKCETNESSLKFDASSFTFSPTGLIEYAMCPKKFELSKILMMPGRGDFNEKGTGATTGSFVHELFETGVTKGFDCVDDYMREATKMLPKWPGVDVDEVKQLVDVFFERNKGKYGAKSKTELALSVELGGFRFFGLADRVDMLDDGTVEVIDYKTNKGVIEPKKRAWQLGFYALGLIDSGFRVSKLTLDMLRLEKPVSMCVDEKGNVSNVRGKGFLLSDVKAELIEAAKKVAYDYEHEFLPAEDETNCRFCGYKFYCTKWDE